jgi:ADP-heptose:LPS heptosyltransferase
MTKNQKILVFRFSAMGDVAMTAPVLRALVQQNPDIEIVMVSRPFFAPIFKDIPNLQFIAVDLKNYKGFFGLFKLFKELRKLKPTAIADLHDVLRSKVLRSLFKTAGYQVKSIDKGRKAKKALTRTQNKLLKPLRSTHERYADVFRKLGYSIDLNQLKTGQKPSLSSQTKLFLDTFEEQKLIGIAPFAAHEGKQYPLEKIEEVIKQLLDKDSQISILLFGGGKEEKQRLDELEKINRNRVVNLAGMFRFDEELQLISRLQLMLSMDSGNGHLAALFNVPVITIWGATHPFAGFAPLGQPEQQQIIPDLKQYPQLPTSVYGNKTFEGFNDVWKTISVENVINTVCSKID